MGVVSVRLEERDERYLRRRRLSISQIARDAVRERVRRMQAEEDLDFLAAHSWKPRRSAEVEIRELRDARKRA